MNVSVTEKTLAFDGDIVSSLGLSHLHEAIGAPWAVERITMRGGGLRFRECWPEKEIELLRDEGEPSALCLFVSSPKKDVPISIMIGDHAIPADESKFQKAFPEAKRGIGHSYSMEVGKWRLSLDFKRHSRVRGPGSSVYKVFRLIIHGVKPVISGTSSF